MRAVVQRVRNASVRVSEMRVSYIDYGILIYIGVASDDSHSDVLYLSEKISNLRIFPDQDEKMNLSVKDIAGSALIVSQFTLFADARKGRRPSYSDAAPPELASILYTDFISALSNQGIPVYSGIFQASMQVEYINDGPITILLDSKKTF